MICPKCCETLVNTAHGPYCPRPTCKWGWEVEMDGSPLKPPVTVPTELRICEVEHLFLHPNQLYIFTVDENCHACVAYAKKAQV